METKLKSLYCNGKNGIPVISIIFLITILIVSVPTFFVNSLYEVFADFAPKSIHVWQPFTCLFEHALALTPDTYPWFIWVHMGTNIAILLTFGLIVEQRMNKFMFFGLTICAGMASSILTFLSKSDAIKVGTIAGASGIVYAYIPVALYFIIRSIIQNKKNILKQPLLYVYGVFIFCFWGVITYISTWQGTNKFHFVATMIGCIFVILFHKHMGSEWNFVLTGNKRKEKVNKLWLSLSVIPMFMIALEIAYFTNNIHIMYMWR